MQRILLIANPVAGGDSTPLIERARRALCGAAEVEVHLTKARGDAEAAAAAARNGGYDRIVAAGGDGTLGEVANGLAPSKIPLGFIPLGTTNVFAIEAGIPRDIEGACRVALEGEARPVCFGLAGQRRFLLMAGVGFDAAVVAGVDGGVKRRLGKGAYVLQALRQFARGVSWPIEVEDEGGVVRQGYGCIICNARNYGGRFAVTPEASLFTGRFDVCLFRRPGRWPLLRTALRVALRLPPRPPDAELFSAVRLAVRGEGPVQLDGDAEGGLPMTFESRLGELVMVFPRRKDGER